MVPKARNFSKRLVSYNFDLFRWKYEQAFESSQKYKEGKYIIELAHMIKENGWENES